MTALAKPSGNLPAYPHQYMTKLDDEGTAYWLEDVSLINGRVIPRADVMGHGPDWLTLREGDSFNTQAAPVWTIRAAHVVCYRMMEG